jgi:hypothetical protein
MQHIIWAFSRTPPESADEDSQIWIHHRFGSSVLNLTRTTTAPVSEDESEDAPLPSPVPSAEAGNATRPADAASAIGSGGGGGGGFVNFVHAGLCILAFLIVIPSGALVVRYAKATGSSAAFRLHRNLQFGVGAYSIFGSSRPLTNLTYSRLCSFSSSRAACRTLFYFLNLYSWYVHCRGHARVPFHGQQWLCGSAQSK